MRVGKMAKVLGIERLGNGPFSTMDPFLFCVYHKDKYPAGNEAMEAPRMGNGMDFNPTADYRMYHGDTIPGFPKHGHRGFETLTATMTGLIDHADSVGNAGRYGEGDLQWMTAGEGVVHSETFPLLETTKPNPLRFFQIWLNLPKKSKMVKPGFAMFWAPDVPQWQSEDSLASVTVWAGNNYFGVETNNAPPPDSWAADPANDVGVMHITVQPGGKMTLPAANTGKAVSRTLFYVEGGNKLMKVDGEAIPERSLVKVQPDTEIDLEMDASAPAAGEFLLLQGKPIAEPVAQHGPFVMNTQSEIEQAFMDYRRTQFGGWPWPREDMVFDRDKKRFALVNGKETSPPLVGETCEAKE